MYKKHIKKSKIIQIFNLTRKEMENQSDILQAG